MCSCQAAEGEEAGTRSCQQYTRWGKLESLKRNLGAVEKGNWMLTAQLPKIATILCFWICVLILLYDLAHVDGQRFALWCFDSTSLSWGCLSFLVAHAASWEQRMPHPMLLGCQAQVQCSVPMLICRCDRDQRALDGLCLEAWGTRRSQ